jgi:hypothetical protein
MRNFIVRWLSLVPLRRGEAAGPGARAPRPDDAPQKARMTGSFPGVELRTRGTACRPARSLARKRLLATEAPPVPLEGCTLRTRCNCYYIQHDDRRSGEPRRNADAGISGSFYTGPERRSGLDRRRRKRSSDDSYYEYMRDRDRRHH